MNINWQTKKKANEIQNLLSQGYSQKDILEKKFGRSKRKMNEHLEVAKTIYTKQEFDILTGVHVVETTPIAQATGLPQALQLLSDDININKLEMLLENADDLLELLENKADSTPSVVTDSDLVIPEEMLKYTDIKSKSIRISEGILKEFDKFSEKNKLYSKTALYNFALKEFIEKYSNE